MKSEAKKIAKIINIYLSKSETYRSLYKANTSVAEVKENIGNIIKYYIMTRDNNTDIDLEDLIGRVMAIQSNQKEYIKNGEHVKYEYDKNQIINNTNKNGFVTHSFNAFLKDKVNRNGLRTTKNKDAKLEKDLEYLESMVGKNKYLSTQDEGNFNEMYVAAPGAASVHYATGMNPERLYLGPLEGIYEPDLAMERRK